MEAREPEKGERGKGQAREQGKRVRSRLRLIGKKIALARRLVSLLTCTQHLRLKYRIRRPLSSFPSRANAPLSRSPSILFSVRPSSRLLLTQRTAVHPPCSNNPLLLASCAPVVFFRLWSVHQPFLHDLVRQRNSWRHRESPSRDSSALFLSLSLGYRIASRATAVVVPRRKLGKTLFLKR